MKLIKRVMNVITDFIRKPNILIKIFIFVLYNLYALLLLRGGSEALCIYALCNLSIILIIMKNERED